MEKLDLVMDIFPSTFSPIENQDYCARQIFPLIHESLLIKTKNGIRCNYFIDSFNMDFDTITFVFNDKGRWNTGEPILPEHYKIFAYKNVNLDSDFNDCFDFIEQDSSGFPIVTTIKNKLIVKLKFIPPNIKEYFASSVWLPLLHSDERANGKYSGVYELRYHDSKGFLLTSKYDGYPDLNFRILKSLDKPIELFLNETVHITCPTYFPFCKLSFYSKHPSFSHEYSDIQFILDINYDKLPEIKNVNVKKRLLSAIDTDEIEAILYRGCTSWRFFSGINHSSHLHDIQWSSILNGPSFDCQKIIWNSLEICFSDFYPNEEVVDAISKQLINSNICNEVIKRKLSFQELYDNVDSKKSEFALLLELPSIKNTYHIYSSYKKYISKENLTIYEAILNAIRISTDDVNINDMYVRLEKMLQSELPFIPLLNGKHLFFKHDSLNFLHLDQDGRLIIVR